MKIQGELYKTMKDSIEKLSTSYKVKNCTVKEMWDLWNHCSFDLMNDDNHPAFQMGYKRVNNYISGFNIYKDDTINNSHIETALIKIKKELEI